jgi:tyrosyl-tRNA synthetase
MLGKEMVRARLESQEGMSYTEFSYQLLQAYDFLHLFDQHAVTLQIGGSDQWGNITAGVELVRKVRGQTVYGLTFPLLTRSDGKKFGKSEEGAIWLSADKLSPYEFYQYLVRTADCDVIRLMRMLTLLPLGEVNEWQRRMEEPDYVANGAQKALASEVTKMVHGSQGLEVALKITADMAPGRLISSGAEGALTGAVLEELIKEIPSAAMDRKDLLGATLVDLLVTHQLVESKSEARRVVRNGGIYLNDQKVEAEEHSVSPTDLIEERFLLLSVGKKKKKAVIIYLGPEK